MPSTLPNLSVASCPASISLALLQVFGFLASFMFLADVGMFWSRRGSPFKVQQPTNGNQTGVKAEPLPPQPEMENLNPNTETAE